MLKKPTKLPFVPFYFYKAEHTGFNSVEHPYRRRGGMRKSILIFLVCVCTFLGPFLLSVLARVSGTCDNCHTMHHSQGGEGLPGVPEDVLLVNDCLGCHSSTDAGEWKNSFGAPIVYNSSAPTYGATSDGGTTHQGLAGGNFYWVKTDDAKGHNVFADNPDSLTTAPGGVSGQGVGCGTDSCHDNLYASYSDTVPGLQGRQACTKCHMLDDLNQPKGFHHADDSAGVMTEFPWYRFLKGHYGLGSGVSGIEDDNWEHDASSAVHNEYLGEYQEGGNVSDNWSLVGRYTMTAYCCGCHGDFHVQGDGGSWIRHPSDAVLPVGTPPTEYQAYTVYNPLVPVARPDLSGGPTPDVIAGKDMVMCLSCHRPHGSPYNDMLRWDYAGMIAGTTGAAAGTGCFICHTSKDGQ